MTKIDDSRFQQTDEARHAAARQAMQRPTAGQIGRKLIQLAAHPEGFAAVEALSKLAAEPPVTREAPPDGYPLDEEPAEGTGQPKLAQAFQVGDSAKHVDLPSPGEVIAVDPDGTVVVRYPSGAKHNYTRSEVELGLIEKIGRKLIQKAAGNCQCGHARSLHSPACRYEDSMGECDCDEFDSGGYDAARRAIEEGHPDRAYASRRAQAGALKCECGQPGCKWCGKQEKDAQTVEEEQQLRDLGWSDAAIEGMSEKQIGLLLQRQTRNPQSVGQGAEELPMAAGRRAAKPGELQVGDLVKYTAKFMQSTGMYTGGPIDGKVVGNGGSMGDRFVQVHWNDRDEPVMVNVANIMLKHKPDYTGSKEVRASGSERSGVRRLEADASALQQPWQSEVPALRRPRHPGMREVAGELRRLPGGHGPAARGPQPRPEGQRRQLRAGELPVGHSDPAEQEHQAERVPGHHGRAKAADRLGRGDGHPGHDTSQADASRVPGRGAADPRGSHEAGLAVRRRAQQNPMEPSGPEPTGPAGESATQMPVPGVGGQQSGGPPAGVKLNPARTKEVWDQDGKFSREVEADGVDDLVKIHQQLNDMGLTRSPDAAQPQLGQSLVESKDPAMAQRGQAWAETSTAPISASRKTAALQWEDKGGDVWASETSVKLDTGRTRMVPLRIDGRGGNFKFDSYDVAVWVDAANGKTFGSLEEVQAFAERWVEAANEQGTSSPRVGRLLARQAQGTAPWEADWSVDDPMGGEGCPLCDASVPQWSPGTGTCSACGYDAEEMAGVDETVGGDPLFEEYAGTVQTGDAAMVESRDAIVGPSQSASRDADTGKEGPEKGDEFGWKPKRKTPSGAPPAGATVETGVGTPGGMGASRRAQGYTDCACRDCFETAINGAGQPTLCSACEEAGCDVSGGSECLAPGAYDGEEERDAVMVPDDVRSASRGSEIIAQLSMDQIAREEYKPYSDPAAADKPSDVKCSDCGTKFEVGPDDYRKCPSCGSDDVSSIFGAKLLAEYARWLTADKNEYQKFVDDKAKEWGIDHPFDQPDEKVKDFFEEIDREWGHDKDGRQAADKMSVECMECGKKFKTSSSEPKCPKCGSYDIDLAMDASRTADGKDVPLAAPVTVEDTPTGEETFSDSRQAKPQDEYTAAALRALSARGRGTRYPCPTCGKPDAISAQEKAKGYQCRECTYRDEGGEAPGGWFDASRRTSQEELVDAPTHITDDFATALCGEAIVPGAMTYVHREVYEGSPEPKARFGFCPECEARVKRVGRRRQAQPIGMPPAAAGMTFERSNERSDGDRVKWDVAWDPETVVAMSGEGIKNQLRSYALREVSQRQATDRDRTKNWGFIGDVQVEDLDVDGGIATISFQTSEQSAPQVAPAEATE